MKNTKINKKQIQQVKDAMLTSEQETTMRMMIVSVMRDAFVQGGITGEEFDDTFGETAYKCSHDIVHKVQMALMQEATYAQAVEQSQSVVKKVKKLITKKKKVKKTKKSKK